MAIHMYKKYVIDSHLYVDEDIFSQVFSFLFLILLNDQSAAVHLVGRFNSSHVSIERTISSYFVAKKLK